MQPLRLRDGEMEKRLIPFINNCIERRAELRQTSLRLPSPAPLPLKCHGLRVSTPLPPNSSPSLSLCSSLRPHCVLYPKAHLSSFFILLHDCLLGVFDYIDTCQIRAGTSIKLSHHMVSSRSLTYRSMQGVRSPCK